MVTRLLRAPDALPALGIFASSAAAILLFWSLLPGGWQVVPKTDYTDFYSPVGMSIARGEGFVAPGSGPAVRYPPGFPIILGGLYWLADRTGTSPDAWVQYSTLPLMGVAAVLIYRIAVSITTRPVALVAAFVWIVYPPNLWLTRQPNSEIAFFPLFYLALVLVFRVLSGQLAKPGTALLAGGALGVATLVRPYAVFLGLALSVFMFWSWRRPKTIGAVLALTFLLGNAAPLLPWVVWVRQQTGQWHLLSTGGRIAVIDGLTCAVRLGEHRDPVDIPEGARHLMADISAADDRGEISTSGSIVRFLVSETAKRPAAVLELVLWKMKRAWYGTDGQLRQEPLIALVQLAFVIPALIGGVMLWFESQRGRRWIVMVVTLVLYFWGMTTAVLSILRYMIPPIGLLCVLHAIALRGLYSRVRRRVARRGVAGVGGQEDKRIS